MKKATVLGLSSNHKLIIMFDDGKTFLQTRFQGFDIKISDLKSRTFFDELIGKDIECSFNKNQKTIRYQNESLIRKLIEKGVLTVIPKELQESKVYTTEQKNNFLQMTKSNQIQEVSNPPILLNKKENQNVLQTIIKSKVTLKAKIEYLSDQILIRFQYEGKTVFLKCKISNCKHYFQLFSQDTFWKSKFLPCEIDLTIIGQKYNILKKSTEVNIKLPDEITQKLIEQGWISLDQKSYYKNSRQSFKKLHSVEKQTIKSGKGIHSSKSQILSFIYAKNNYVGIVTNVIEGYVYQITSLKTQQVSKIQLPMVICPVGQDTGAFDCRQFARRQLIGKQVNVYLQKQQGLNTTGNIIRIQDWKDIESVLLQSGFAYVRDQLKNTILGQKLVLLENKAKQNRKGLHKKDIGSKRFEDLCQQPFSKAHFESYVNRRYQVLSKLNEKQEVVVEQIYNSLSFKLRIESIDLLVNFRLQGVLKPNLNPNLKEYEQIKNEANIFLKRHFYQRTMIAFFSDYDQETNQFIGTLKLDKDKNDVQQILIKESFVYADKFNFVKKYNDLQASAKKGNKLIWQQNLRCFEPSFGIDKEKYCFEGKFSWIHNGKIAYIQPKDNFKTIEKIQNKIREMNLPKLHKDKLKIGAWCAAPYDGQLYRAVIKQRKDHMATVQFFDWGNQQVINIDLLKQLPQQFLYLEKQSIKVTLNLVAPTKNKQAIENVRQMLFDGGVYVFKKVHGDSVDFFAGQTSSVNEQLILKGILKADKRQIKKNQNVEVLSAVQQQLRKQRMGIWEQSDSSEEQTQDYLA